MRWLPFAIKLYIAYRLDNKFRLGKLLDDLKRVENELPRLLANQAQTYFAESFTRGGLEGEPKWKEVNRRIPGTKEYKYPKTKKLARRTKPILTLTGALRRKVNNSIKLATWRKIELSVELPYAEAQNEGNPARNLDARPFMIDTRRLQEKQIKLIDETFDRIFQW